MRVPGTIWSIGELKSAFQKCIRRRDARAYQIAHILLAEGETGTRALLRRLVTIAAEEGTFGVVPEASELLRAYGDEGTREQVTAEAVLRVVGRVMATARDKDPAYLQDWPCAVDGGAWPAERSAVMLWRGWSVKRGLRCLQVCGEALPAGLTREVVLALHRRGRMGVLEGDLKIFCAIALALVEREARNEAPILPVAEPIAIPPRRVLTALPWWCFDPHVAVGKKALKAVLAHSADRTWERAFVTWFRLVSDRLEGYVAREGWRGQRYAHDITEADVAWWHEVEPLAQEAIESALRARTPTAIRASDSDAIVSAPAAAKAMARPSGARR